VYDSKIATHSAILESYTKLHNCDEDPKKDEITNLENVAKIPKTPTPRRSGALPNLRFRDLGFSRKIDEPLVQLSLIMLYKECPMLYLIRLLLFALTGQQHLMITEKNSFPVLQIS
jgi:hypothetical protein